MRLIRSVLVAAVAAVAVLVVAVASAAAPASAAPPTSLTALTEVSCPTTGFCLAAGVAPASSRFLPPPMTLALRKHGRWVDHPVTGLHTSGYAAAGVSCASASSCVVVLRRATSDNEPLATIVFDGTVWRPVPAAPVDPAAQFAAVSCASPTRCVAVGYWSTATRTTSFAERWDGTTWTASTLPAYPASSVEVMPTDISCPTTTSCTLVASRRTGNITYSGVVARLTGSTWTWVPAAETPPGDTSLDAISCRTASSCLAVGRAGDDQLVESLAGGRWSVVQQSVPGGPYSGLDVACPAGATTCLQTSDTYDPAADIQHAAAQLVDGSGVLRNVTPTHVGAASRFDAVSCPAVSTCVAVGGYSTAADPLTELDLGATWNGRTWTREAV